MIFQKVLKGIIGISQPQARAMLIGGGITCNWWRKVNLLPANEIPVRLTQDNLLRHLSAYDQPDPITGSATFGEMTPFISTTAGAVERDPANAQNWQFSAFLTALAFATDSFRQQGAIFYGYVNVLGKKSVVMDEFAEETRELNIWTEFQPYHPEGEIVAKIQIPSPHLEKVEGYDGPSARARLNAHKLPVPLWIEQNTSHYVPPEELSNVREVLL
jgi:hypothetical protein